MPQDYISAILIGAVTREGFANSSLDGRSRLKWAVVEDGGRLDAENFSGQKREFASRDEAAAFVRDQNAKESHNYIIWDENLLTPEAAGITPYYSRKARTFSEAREAAQDFVGKPIANANGLVPATVSNNTLNKMLSESAARKSTSPQDHAMAVANLDELYRVGVLDESHPDRNAEPTIAAVHRVVAPMVGAGNDVLAAKMTVKETTGEHTPNPLYSVQSLEIEKPALDAPQSGIERATGQVRNAPQAGFSPDVTRMLADFKRRRDRDSADTDFGQPSRYTFRESDYRAPVLAWAKERFGDLVAPNGKPEWQNFARWFGDSKVVDERRFNHPNFTAADWKKVPEWLESPVAVFERDDGHMTFIAPETLIGKPIIIGVIPDS